MEWIKISYVSLYCDLYTKLKGHSLRNIALGKLARLN